MFSVPCDWKPTLLSDLPSFRHARAVAIDCETCDPDLTRLGPGPRRGGYVVGVAVAIQGGPAIYLPVAHGAGPNTEGALAWLREEAEAFTGILVNANLAYDLDFLAEAGVAFPRARWFRDVLIADPLIHQHEFSYSLDSVAKRWFPGRGKDEGLLKKQAELAGLHHKAELWKMPAKYVAEYAMEDVRLALDLYGAQCSRIEKEKLWDVFDLESKLLPVLVRMRRRGVRVDMKRLEQVEVWARAQELLALEAARGLTGVEVDVNRTESVAQAIKSLGLVLPVAFTPKGKQSWDAAVLEAIDHPAARAILRAKKMNKIRTTFAASVRRHETGGRIHCTLNQIRYERDTGDLAGAGFGRLASTNPNLHQQPGRDPELGPFWRSVYVPEEGERWVSADYSGQEPRWIVHYAELVGAKGAREMAREYRENPDLDLHQKTADLAGIKRKDAKTIFLGIAYGMGGAKLCAALGLPLLGPKETSERRAGMPWLGGRAVFFAGPEGQAVMDRFNEMVPFLKFLQKKASRRAARAGEVRTVLGRACKFVRHPSGEYESTHKALNRIIQGSSADQTKKALVDADAAGLPVLLQVHDEIDMSASSEHRANELAQIMCDTLPMGVPAKVDLELGKSWGDSMAEAPRSRELMGVDW